MLQQELSSPQKLRTPSQRWKLPAGMQVYSSKEAMEPERIELLEEMAFEHGRYFDSYLITEPNREYLWGSEDFGVVGFSRYGRYLHIAGGIICKEYHRAEFLAEIVEFARLNHLVVSFFSIDDHDAQLFRELGFQISRFGVDSRIELDGHAWGGKPYEWVRRQANYVARQSVSFEECFPEEMAEEARSALFDELKTVSDEHIAGKSQKGEIPFFEGRLIPGHMHRRRIFIARSEDGAGRIEGFLVCNPISSGGSWAIEMYRQRDDAPRGTIPFLMKQAIDQFKAEGCEHVSICPVPTIGTERKLPGSSFPANVGMYLWAKFGSTVFDCKGLYHFKSRFRPDFRDLYICAYPRSNWGAVWAYIMTLGAFDVKWGSIVKKLFSFKPQRRTLADPQAPISEGKSKATVQPDAEQASIPMKQAGSPASQDTEEPTFLKQVS